MKKIAALILSLTLAISMIPATVFAENAADSPATPAKQTSRVAEVPQISTAVSGPGIAIKWKAISNAKSYNVYRSYKKNSGWTLLKKDVRKLSYNDNSVSSGKKAYYKVRALKKDGKYSAYSNVASNTIYRVYIETGHGIDHRGRWDPGCTWKKFQEAKLMLPICKSTAKYLRAKGVYVYTDAFGKNNRNLDWTVRKVNKLDISVFVNVHCDYSKAPKGTMPLYRYSDQKKLARCLNKGVHQYVKIKDRGLHKRKDLKTLNKTKGHVTACLFETGNIKKDNKILRKQYDAYGKGLAKGVCDYLGVKW